MKPMSALLSSLLLLSALSGCAARTPAPPAESGSGLIPVPSELPALPPEPPMLDWMDEVVCPEFLDEDLQELYLRACTAAQFLILSPDTVEEFPLANGSRLDLVGGVEHDTVRMDGLDYTISQGRYSRWDDFQAMLDSLFTPACQAQLLSPDGGPPRFASTEDGGLCYRSGGRECNAHYSCAHLPDLFALVSQTDQVIEFTLIGHYLDPTAAEPPGDIYTQEFPLRLERTQKGWRFAEFHLPY